MQRCLVMLHALSTILVRYVILCCHDNVITIAKLQPNCYSKIITVDGRKKIIIFARRR